MKYLNTHNNLTYWKYGDDVMFSDGEIIVRSQFNPHDIDRMKEMGTMIEIKVSKESFKKLVEIEKLFSPQYQIRYIAFMVHVGREVWKGNVAVRNARFMRWISDRKAEYMQLSGLDEIINQEDFTDFIVSGKWL